MEGFVCDRCETFDGGMLKRRKSIDRTDYNDRQYRTIRFGYLTGEDETGSVSTTVDLCGDCRRELAEWVGQETIPEAPAES